MSIKLISFYTGCLLLIFSISQSCKSPASESVEPTTYSVGHAQIKVSAEHNDELNLVASYPTNQEGDFPLIVFSHGNGLSANAYHNLTDTWVQDGYVVVAPDHLDSGGMDVASAAQKEHGGDWVSASRVMDLLVCINKIKTITAKLPEFKGTVNTTNVIAAGHSFGALSAQMIGGATLEMQGNSQKTIPSTLKDDRIVAVVAISPPGLIPNFLYKNTWTDFNKPQLVVTGTKDISPPFWNTYDVHLVSYESAVPGSNYLLVLDGADHYLGNLIGNLTLEEAPQELALQNLQEQSMMFINQHMRSSSKNKLNITESLNNRKGIVRFEHR